MPRHDNRLLGFCLFGLISYWSIAALGGARGQETGSSGRTLASGYGAPAANLQAASRESTLSSPGLWLFGGVLALSVGAEIEILRRGRKALRRRS